jgi:hypothetical protein
MLLFVLLMLYVLVDIQIYRLYQSITIYYIGTEVENPIVIFHIRVFPAIATLGAGIVDSRTSTIGNM